MSQAPVPAGVLSGRARAIVAALAVTQTVAHLFGTVGYAGLSGILAVPVSLALSTAPPATAALQHITGSYTPVLLIASACCTVAAVSIALTGRPARADAAQAGHESSPA
jgi:hypothetical protein